jgi:hypothetical protein
MLSTCILTVVWGELCFNFSDDDIEFCYFGEISNISFWGEVTEPSLAVMNGPVCGAIICLWSGGIHKKKKEFLHRRKIVLKFCT